MKISSRQRGVAVALAGAMALAGATPSLAGPVFSNAAGVKAAIGTKELPKPEAVMADVKAAAEKAIAAAKEVVDLTVGAQKRVAELVTQRVQAPSPG